MDYGLKIETEYGYTRTRCINNKDKVTGTSDKDRVRNCKEYEPGSEENCKTCQFKDEWPHYYI